MKGWPRKDWTNNNYWNTKANEIFETLESDLNQNADVIIFRDGSFRVLGDYNDIEKYELLFTLPFYKNQNMVDSTKSNVERFVAEEKVIIWINLSDPNGAIYPVKLKKNKAKDSKLNSNAPQLDNNELKKNIADKDKYELDITEKQKQTITAILYATQKQNNNGKRK